MLMLKKNQPPEKQTLCLMPDLFKVIQ